jgi:flotillin
MMWFIGVCVLGFLIVAFIISMMFRRVVSTNMVHIVQSRRKTTPYGTGQTAGNVYYAWPSSIPFFGVTVIRLPVSNFDLSLKGYEAYDKDRVPFMVDITAFFRINNTALAAQRVSSVDELNQQLNLIVQGAVRKVLASDVIDSIMLERSKFGAQFTAEVSEQLKEWGVESVKAMELMDIRDTQGSKVISNIMAKKTSNIEMLSRVEVATNMQKAETAEIDAKQIVAVRQQEADQLVGQRTADKEKAVGISQEQSRQEVLTQAKITKTREMEVSQVQQVRTAEIERDKQVVAAEQDKKTRVIIAEGNLEAQKKEAEGIEVIGAAKAEASKAMLLAPVEAQTTLAKEIGSNAGYQQYLMTLEAIKAHLEVGSKQAEALKSADIKVIANTGSPNAGVKNVMDLFTSDGGTNLAAMVESLAQSPMGKSILDKLVGGAGKSTTIAEPAK